MWQRRHVKTATAESEVEMFTAIVFDAHAFSCNKSAAETLDQYKTLGKAAI